jgi:hypothetical protein
MNVGSAPMAGLTTRASSPAYQAYQMLHVIFTLAPIIAGVDKFFHFLVNWDQYLAPVFAQLLGGHTFMLAAGAIEIVAGLIVAFKPRLGGYLVALWLWGIIINLLLNPMIYDTVHRSWGLDIALRDLGLSIGALALARLSVEFEKR